MKRRTLTALGVAGVLVLAGLALLQSDFLARAITSRVLRRINQQIHGELSVSHIAGSILRRIELRDVALRSDRGDTVLTIAQAVLRYRVGNIIAGRFAFEHLALNEPRVLIGRDDVDQPISLLSILPESSGGTGPLVTFDAVEVHRGAVQLSLLPLDDSWRGTAGSLSLAALEGAFAAVRLSSPDPSVTPGARIQAVRAQLQHPDWGEANLAGEIQWVGDSVTLTLPSVALSESAGGLAGWITLAETVQADMVVDIQSLGAGDVARIAPDIADAMTARGRAHIYSGGDGAWAVDGTGLELTGARAGGVTGNVAVTLGADGTWRVRDAGLVLAGVNPHRALSTADSARFGGVLDGTVAARGELSNLFVEADVGWQYAGEPRRLRSVLRAAGSIGGENLPAVDLRGVRIAELSVPLSTVRRISPDLPLEGRVVARGEVSGSTVDPRFAGRILHVSPQGTSALQGNLAVSRRGSQPTLAADFAFDSLQQDTWSPFFPTVPLTGPLAGQVAASGHVDSVALQGWLESPAGLVSGSMSAVRQAGGIALTALALEARRVDLARAHSLWPHTRLNAALTGGIAIADGRPVTAWMITRLDSSSLEEVLIDSVHVVARLDDGILAVDTVHGWATGISLAGGGTLGTTDTRSGSVRFSVAADTSTLFARLAGSRVTTRDWSTGPLDLTGVVEGSLDDYRVTGTLTGRGVRFENATATRLAASGGWQSTTGTLHLDAALDTLEVGGVVAASVRSRLAGRTDSLDWQVRAQADSTHLAGGGTTRLDSLSRTIEFDSLQLRWHETNWSVTPGASVGFGSDGAIRTESLTVSNQDGPGRVSVVGSLLPRGDAELAARVEDIPLEGLAALVLADSIQTGGSLDAELTVTGTPESPRSSGTFIIRNGRFGSFGVTRIAGSSAYGDRRASATFDVYDDTVRLASVQGEFPIDLSFQPEGSRRIAGPIGLSVVVDTLSIARLASLIPQLRDPQGILVASLEARGTVADPVLSGHLEFRDGAAGVPALGTRYHDINALVTLSRDTLHLSEFSMRSGNGAAQMSGHAWFERLDRPVLDIRVEADNFRALALPDFVTLTASGQLALQGPPDQATLTMQAVANEGVLYFADLLTKQIVDLNDTLFASFVDTALLRQEGIGAERSRQLLERLDIDSALVDLGDDFWLRSTEGDIQLTGQLLAAKRGTDYRVDGTLNAARGTYRLQVAPGVNREFTVTRGQVQYFGTPDLNADLDIDAQHVVRTFGGESVTVMVHLGGTVYEPVVSFSSDVVPALSEPEIISYLVFGTPDVQAFAGNVGQRGFLVQQGADQLALALSDRLERSVINTLGLPVDYFQIRPGDAGRGFSDTEIAIGKRIAIFGRPAFFTASPRLCPRQQLVSVQNVGASVETRLARRWLLTASVDPFRACEASTTPAPSRYQLGVDLIWERRN